MIPCHCGHSAQAHGPYGCESCAESGDFFDQCFGYQPAEED